MIYPFYPCKSVADSALLPNSKQRLAVFYGLTVFDVDFDDLTRNLGLYLVHQLHGFDDTNRRLVRYHAAFAYIKFLWKFVASLFVIFNRIFY